MTTAGLDSDIGIRHRPLESCCGYLSAGGPMFGRRVTRACVLVLARFSSLNKSPPGALNS